MQPTQCISCKHYLGVHKCEAFGGYTGDDIPSEIFTGQHDHSEPYEGDNGIRYEVSDEWKAIEDES